MEAVLEASLLLGRACRNTANIKNRQPIGKMYVKARYGIVRISIQISLQMSLNVKEVVFSPMMSVHIRATALNHSFVP